MYLGWALVVFGGFAVAARTRGEFDERASQDAMAALLTEMHQRWSEEDPKAFDHLARKPYGVPSILRQMAKTCVEMADELERDGVTVFTHAEGRR